jgi:hypothetical protein
LTDIDFFSVIHQLTSKGKKSIFGPDFLKGMLIQVAHDIFCIFIETAGNYQAIPGNYGTVP